MKALLVLLFLCAATAHKYKSLFDELDIANYNTRLVEQADPHFKITASPNVLHENAEFVTVVYEGVQNPTKNDWIGVYSPANVDIKNTSPVKYKWATVSDNYLRTGSGSTTFRLLNMRSDYAFVFFTNGTASPIAVGKSNSVSFTNYNYPAHARIALTHTPGQIKVTWVSNEAKSPQVKYGTRPGVYSHTAPATSFTYTAKDLCGPPATTFGWRDPGMIHYAVMKNLNPGTKYYYVYGDQQSGGWSEEGSFYGPQIATANSVVRMAAYGDMGKAELDKSDEHWEEYPSINTTNNVLKRIDDLDLVLHIGDISYAVGYAAQWDEFLSQVHPVASRVPYMTCIGNHERDYLTSGAHYNGSDSGGECGVPYESHFPMPSPAKDKPYYGFNFGNVHVTMMSTEHNFDVGSEQYNFLAKDLASVNRTATPWLIFAGHRPMYIDSTNYSPDGGDQTVAVELRDNLEHLLAKYRVDLALWGHHHSYQRSCPVFQSKCHGEGKAPVHVVIGMAGMGLSQNLEDPKPGWLQYVDDQEYGYSLIDTTAKTLHMRYYNNNNDLKDQFTLRK
jgi:hypothetical protein